MQQVSKGVESLDSKFVDNLHFIKELGFQIKKALEMGECRKFGELMHQHWLHKIKQTSDISNNEINGFYEAAMKNGALGGKLIGAGGGGFLLFYAENRNLVRETMRKMGLTEVRFSFDFEGAKQIV